MTNYISATSFKQGLRVITADTIESVVLDPSKDVILDIYQPKCPSCMYRKKRRRKTLLVLPPRGEF